MDSLTQLQTELERILNQVQNGINTLHEEQTRRAAAASSMSEPAEK